MKSPIAVVVTSRALGNADGPPKFSAGPEIVICGSATGIVV